MCFNSDFENLPPLYPDGILLPYTGSFKYLGVVCNKQINLNTVADTKLRPFMAGALWVNGFTHAYGFSRHTLTLMVCMRVRFGSNNKINRWTVPYRNGCWQC